MKPLWNGFKKANSGLFIFLMVLSVSCGSGAKKKTDTGSTGPKGSGDVLKALDCSAAGDTATLRLTTAEAVELRHVPAEDIIVSQGEVPVSLCDAMRANGDAKLGLFMFVSASCYKCQKWMEKVAQGLEPYGNTLLPVAIVSESSAVLSNADLDELKEEVAPDFLWVRDPEGEAWKFFSPDTAADQRVSPLVLEMDTAARGFVIEDTALEAKDLVSRADEALGLGLGSGS